MLTVKKKFLGISKMCNHADMRTMELPGTFYYVTLNYAVTRN